MDKSLIDTILIAGEIAVAILLITSILFQKQGGGLSSTMGGSGEVYRTKRGAEKILLKVTIALAIVLGLIAIARLLI